MPDGNCQQCGSRMSWTNDLAESLKWGANPLGLATSLAYQTEAFLTGKRYAQQYRCGRCDSYELRCGHCDRMVRTSGRKRHNDQFKCPHCGQFNRVEAV